MDLICRLIGRKPFLIKISSLMQKGQKALEPFTTNSWEWSHDNMDKLWEELGQEDRDIFPFDLRNLDWIEFLEKYVQVNSTLEIIAKNSYLLFRESENFYSKRRTPPYLPLRDILTFSGFLTLLLEACSFMDWSTLLLH